MAHELMVLTDLDARRIAAERGGRRLEALAARHGDARAVRHSFGLWLGDRLIRTGERLRAWSLPECRSAHAP